MLQKGNSKRLICKEEKNHIYAIAVQKTKINAKFDKNTTLIRRLSSLYIWKEHGILKKNN